MANLADQTTAFMEQFLGYGSLEADTWLLGPEEAGVDTIEQLGSRLAVWASLGSEPVVDLRVFHERLGVTKFFSQRPRVQPTWRRLIEIVLKLAGEEPTRDAIRTYQAEQLGRVGGDTLLGELMPLPKKSLGSWPFAGLAGSVACLSDRKAYLREVRPSRIVLWRAAIAKHRPKRVFFYGTSGGVRRAWSEVAGTPLVEDEEGYSVGRTNATRFVMLAHPNARGRTRGYFLRAAELAREELG